MMHLQRRNDIILSDYRSVLRVQCKDRCQSSRAITHSPVDHFVLLEAVLRQPIGLIRSSLHARQPIVINGSSLLCAASRHPERFQGEAESGLPLPVWEWRAAQQCPGWLPGPRAVSKPKFIQRIGTKSRQVGRSVSGRLGRQSRTTCIEGTK